MKKQKIDMRLVAVAIFSFLLILLPAYAQSGKIYHLSYSPEEVVALEDVTFSIGVENPSSKTKDYLLDVQVVKEGKIVNTQEFTFTLEKTKGIFFSPMFEPQDIGEFEVIVKLYDRFNVNLIDTKIIKFRSVSHIGPFDIIVTLLTKRVKPGLELPIKVLLENMGTKGADVEVIIKINCPDEVLTQSLTVFVPANKRLEKLVDMQVCEQEGLYNILASISIFNQTWISSMNQFFVNSTFIELSFESPEEIEVQAGQNISFPIEVTNMGNQKIHDLKFVVQKIPLEWQKSSPSSIIEVEPDETVVFIVSITIPEDVEEVSYDVTMTAAAEEVLERRITKLNVVPLAVLPPATIPTEGIPIFRYVLISIVTLLGLVAFKFRNKIGRIRLKTPTYKPQPIQPDRIEILKKLREKIRSRR